MLHVVGCLQTVINERLNKAVRRQEQQASSSKFSARVKRWEIAARAGDIESYGRKVVEVPHAECSAAKIDTTSAFEPPSTVVSDFPFEDLLQSNRWDTWTSQSIKRSFVEAELMATAAERDDNFLIARSWQTGLLPCKGDRHHSRPRR